MPLWAFSNDGYKGRSKPCTMAATEDPTYRCKVCEVAQAASRFNASSLARSFYTCKQCSSIRSTERRRADHAARVAHRTRVREKRRGGEVRLTIGDIRALLAGQDQAYVKEDLLALKRIRAGEPMALGNVQVVALGRLCSPGDDCGVAAVMCDGCEC